MSGQKCQIKKKIVDNILVTGSTVEELITEVRKVLENCRCYGITILRCKFHIAEEVAFAGYVVTANGISPDARRVEAIRDFPAPKDARGDLSWVWSTSLANSYLFDSQVAKKSMSTETCPRFIQCGSRPCTDIG